MTIHSLPSKFATVWRSCPVLCCVVLALILSADTAFGEPPQTILPEPFSKSTPGKYPLSPAWKGELKVTLQNAPQVKIPQDEKLEKLLNNVSADVFIVYAKDSVMHFGTRVIAKRNRYDTVSGIFSYKDTLPNDSELAACATIVELVKLLGRPQDSSMARLCMWDGAILASAPRSPWKLSMCLATSCKPGKKSRI